MNHAAPSNPLSHLTRDGATTTTLLDDKSSREDTQNVLGSPGGQGKLEKLDFDLLSDKPKKLQTSLII